MNGHQHQDEHGGGRKGLSPRWILLGFLAIAAYFLLSEHRAHFIQFLPFLLLLACPLLHAFHGHGDHGGHGGGEREEGGAAQDKHRHEGEKQEGEKR